MAIFRNINIYSKSDVKEHKRAYFRLSPGYMKYVFISEYKIDVWGSNI